MRKNVLAINCGIFQAKDWEEIWRKLVVHIPTNSPKIVT